MSQPRENRGQLQPQPWMIAAETEAVLKALSQGGAELRFVGGCVRDAVLGRPIGDIDIATPEPPDLVIERLTAAGLKAVPTGIAHGTVTAVSGGKAFEITTLRCDVETFGRHARIAFTDDWQEDAARRDFTFNALSCRPDGVLFDYFGGLEDLAAGRVRFVGDPRQRIAEDRLRLLRFFRFLAWYGRAGPDAEGLKAASEASPELALLSGERIQAEILKLLTAPDPTPTLRLMAQHSVLGHAVPAEFNIDRLQQLLRTEQLTGVAPDAIRRLGALLKPDAVGILRLVERWRLSNADRDRLLAIAAPDAWPNPAAGDREQRVLLYRTGAATWVDRVLIAWAEALIEGRNEDADRWRQLLTLPTRWPVPALPLKGRDLRALGLKAGPQIGELLAALEAWWIEQDFMPDRQACLEWVKERLPRSG